MVACMQCICMVGTIVKQKVARRGSTNENVVHDETLVVGGISFHYEILFPNNTRDIVKALRICVRSNSTLKASSE